MTDSIISFSGEHRWLSNFWEEPDGTTVEREYQAFKASSSVIAMMPLLTAQSPGKTKRLGASVDLHPLWIYTKVNVMRYFVANKFVEHPDLARSLKETGDVTIVEGNTWHDNFWGACRCDDCLSIPKKNNLGLIIMEVRRAIISAGEES